MLPADPLVRAFHALVRRRSHEVLVTGPGNSASVADVSDLADRTSERLAAAKIAGRSIVGFSFANGPAFLAGLVACLRRDLVPLLLDAGMTDSERDAAMESCGAAGLVGCDTGWPDSHEAIRVSPQRGGRPAPAGPAVIKLSSGSTGAPRGILTPIESLLADDAALTSTMGLTAADRLLATIPFSHSYALSSLVLPPLVRGTQLVVAQRDAGGFHALELARSAEATVFPTVPAYLSGLVHVGDAPELSPALRRIVSAGAPLLPETARRFRERFGVSVHVFYGASECGGIAYDRDGGAAEAETVGQPVDGVSIEIAGEEIRVRSAAVAAGYYPEGDKRLERGRFVTGDTGVWIGSRLKLTGRTDRFIKVKGNKVNPVEVERVIAQLDGVEDVQVVGVPGKPAGDESVRAVICCRAGRLSAADVQSWCRQRLSRYKVPRIVRFVDSIPVDARGKPSRIP